MEAHDARPWRMVEDLIEIGYQRSRMAGYQGIHNLRIHRVSLEQRHDDEKEE